MFLGIDLGTSGVKVVLIDDAQRVLGTGHAALTVTNPQPGWSEQVPQDWIAATRQAIADLDLPLNKVAGIGLSGQMHGAVCLDSHHQVLRPAILWNDGRASKQAAMLDGDPQFRKRTGNIVFAGFTAPKLVWMQRHEPDKFERTRLVLLPKDYLRLWLTGDAISDMSDASGTAWFDPAKRDWSGDLLAATGMERDQMPALAEGSEIAGHLRADIALELGLPPGIPVAGGGGDNAATAIGAGISGPGTGLISLGTSGVIFTASDRFLPAPETAIHAFCHALPDQWHQMGVMLSAAACLDWWAGIAGQPVGDLLAELDDHPAIPGTIAFWPYLSGERTPLNNPAQRAGFTGLYSGATRPQMTRAVLEGVTLALAENMAALRHAGGGADSMIAMGGGARSDLWLAMLAQATGVPVLRPAGSETGAGFGAARLGLMAATGAGADALTQPEIAARFDPDPALVSGWTDGLARLQEQRA